MPRVPALPFALDLPTGTVVKVVHPYFRQEIYGVIESNGFRHGSVLLPLEEVVVTASYREAPMRIYTYANLEVPNDDEQIALLRLASTWRSRFVLSQFGQIPNGRGPGRDEHVVASWRNVAFAPVTLEELRASPTPTLCCAEPHAEASVIITDGTMYWHTLEGTPERMPLGDTHVLRYRITTAPTESEPLR